MLKPNKIQGNKMKSQNLSGPWLQAYDDAVKNCHLLDSYSIDNFLPTYKKYLKQAILIHQHNGSNINIDSAVNIVQECERYAISELKSNLKHRNSLKAILEAVEAAHILFIPGSRNNYNGTTTRLIHILIAIKTTQLSNLEVANFPKLFNPEHLEYDSDKNVMAIKGYELELEGPEPNDAENLLLAQEAKRILPATIVYLKSTIKNDITWRDHLRSLRLGVIDQISQFLGNISNFRINTSSVSIDEEALEDIKLALKNHRDKANQSS